LWGIDWSMAMGQSGQLIVWAWVKFIRSIFWNASEWEMEVRIKEWCTFFDSFDYNLFRISLVNALFSHHPLPFVKKVCVGSKTGFLVKEHN
jgi:hypothetical protein